MDDVSLIELGCQIEVVIGVEKFEVSKKEDESGEVETDKTDVAGETSEEGLPLFEVCSEENVEVCAKLDCVKLDCVRVRESLLKELALVGFVIELGRCVLVMLLLLSDSILVDTLVILKPLSGILEVEALPVSKAVLDLGTLLVSKKLLVLKELLVSMVVSDIDGVLLLLREEIDEMEVVGTLVELKLRTWPCAIIFFFLMFISKFYFLCLLRDEFIKVGSVFSRGFIFLE